VASLFPLLFAAKKQRACCTRSRNLSCVVTAKLWVPLGSPDQESAGEMFCPLQAVKA
jgi:hypothetical protein